MSENTQVEDLKALGEVKTPIKAGSVTKGTKARTAESKTAFVIKASPEKLAADRLAESIQDYARYEKEVEELEDAYEEKHVALDRVICVREAAHRRAVAEFEKVYGCLSEEDRRSEFDEQGNWYATRSLRFAKKLEDTVFSFAAELDKAVSDKAASFVRYRQKHDKLWEEYSRN